MAGAIRIAPATAITTADIRNDFMVDLPRLLISQRKYWRTRSVHALTQVNGKKFSLSAPKKTKARPAPLWGRGSVPSRRPLPQAADLTSTFLACAGAGFGTVTLSTPLEMFALMASALTPSGNSSVRSNEP
jgi:hypothetical protein